MRLLSRREHQPPRTSAAANKILQSCMGLVIGELPGRMLAETGGRRLDRAAFPPIEREFRAADQVDGDTCRVRAVLDREPEFQIDRHAAEHRALYADEGDLVVILPCDIV